MVFYANLREYTKGIENPKDLNAILDRALEDSFALYAWLKGLPNLVIYEVNSKEGGNRDS